LRQTKQDGRAWWAVAVLACLAAGSDPTTKPPSPEELANATFAGVFEAPVTLRGGKYEGEPFVPGGAARPRLLLLDSLTTLSDLTGDGVEEAVVFLAESSSGSGTRLYLAIAVRTGGGGLQTQTALIGDRARIRSVRVSGPEVVVDLLQAGPKDAACCPRDLATRTWSVGPTGLTETAQVVAGRLSLATLAETRWWVTRLAFREPVPRAPRLTLSIQGDGGIAGFAGCNTYQGHFKETDSGNLHAGPLATTRKLCPAAVMQLEATYLERLGAVHRFGFLMGQLTLHWRTEDGGEGSLMFEPAAAEPSR